MKKHYTIVYHPETANEFPFLTLQCGENEVVRIIAVQTDFNVFGFFDGIWLRRMNFSVTPEYVLRFVREELGLDKS